MNATPEQRPYWQYEWVDFPNDTLTVNYSGEDLPAEHYTPEEYTWKRGTMGWELAAVYPVENAMRFVFKIPVASQPVQYDGPKEARKPGTDGS